MQHCQFCGTELPINARFCANCGRAVRDTPKGAAYLTASTEPGKQPFDISPTHSSPAHPFLAGAEQKDVTISPLRAERGRTQNIQHPEELQTRSQTALPLPFGYQARQSTPPAPLHRQYTAPWQQVSRIPGTASRLMANRIARWVILLVTVILVLTISGVFLVVANQPPALTVMGSSSVTAGETLHVQGSGFLPNGSIILKLDDGQ